MTAITAEGQGRRPKDLNDLKPCTCRQSRCLKLYCICFHSGVFCSTMCRCTSCLNQQSSCTAVLEARNNIEARNPGVFRAKEEPSAARKILRRGCNCKKSRCLKKYCDCYDAGLACSPELCRCLDCLNCFNGGSNADSATRQSLQTLALQAGISDIVTSSAVPAPVGLLPDRLQQQARALSTLSTISATSAHGTGAAGALTVTPQPQSSDAGQQVLPGSGGSLAGIKHASVLPTSTHPGVRVYELSAQATAANSITCSELQVPGAGQQERGSLLAPPVTATLGHGPQQQQQQQHASDGGIQGAGDGEEQPLVPILDPKHAAGAAWHRGGLSSSHVPVTTGASTHSAVTNMRQTAEQQAQALQLSNPIPPCQQLRQEVERVDAAAADNGSALNVPACNSAMQQAFGLLPSTHPAATITTAGENRSAVAAATAHQLDAEACRLLACQNQVAVAGAEQSSVAVSLSRQHSSQLPSELPAMSIEQGCQLLQDPSTRQLMQHVLDAGTEGEDLTHHLQIVLGLLRLCTRAATQMACHLPWGQDVAHDFSFCTELACSEKLYALPRTMALQLIARLAFKQPQESSSSFLLHAQARHALRHALQAAQHPALQMAALCVTAISPDPTMDELDLTFDAAARSLHALSCRDPPWFRHEVCGLSPCVLNLPGARVGVAARVLLKTSGLLYVLIPHDKHSQRRSEDQQHQPSTRLPHSAVTTATTTSSSHGRTAHSFESPQHRVPHAPVEPLTRVAHNGHERAVANTTLGDTRAGHLSSARPAASAGAAGSDCSQGVSAGALQASASQVLMLDASPQLQYSKGASCQTTHSDTAVNTAQMWLQCQASWQEAGQQPARPPRPSEVSNSLLRSVGGGASNQQGQAGQQQDSGTLHLSASGPRRTSSSSQPDESSALHAAGAAADTGAPIAAHPDHGITAAQNLPADHPYLVDEVTGQGQMTTSLQLVHAQQGALYSCDVQAAGSQVQSHVGSAVAVAPISQGQVQPCSTAPTGSSVNMGVNYGDLQPSIIGSAGKPATLGCAADEQAQQHQTLQLASAAALHVPLQVLQLDMRSEGTPALLASGAVLQRRTPPADSSHENPAAVVLPQQTQTHSPPIQVIVAQQAQVGCATAAALSVEMQHAPRNKEGEDKHEIHAHKNTDAANAGAGAKQEPIRSQGVCEAKQEQVSAQGTEDGARKVQQPGQGQEQSQKQVEKSSQCSAGPRQAAGAGNPARPQFSVQIHAVQEDMLYARADCGPLQRVAVTSKAAGRSSPFKAANAQIASMLQQQQQQQQQQLQAAGVWGNGASAAQQAVHALSQHQTMQRPGLDSYCALPAQQQAGPCNSQHFPHIYESQEQTQGLQAYPYQFQGPNSNQAHGHNYQGPQQASGPAAYGPSSAQVLEHSYQGQQGPTGNAMLPIYPLQRANQYLQQGPSSNQAQQQHYQVQGSVSNAVLPSCPIQLVNQSSCYPILSRDVSTHGFQPPNAPASNVWVTAPQQQQQQPQQASWGQLPMLRLDLTGNQAVAAPQGSWSHEAPAMAVLQQQQQVQPSTGTVTIGGAWQGTQHLLAAALMQQPQAPPAQTIQFVGQPQQSTQQQHHHHHSTANAAVYHVNLTGAPQQEQGHVGPVRGIGLKTGAADAACTGPVKRTRCDAYKTYAPHI